MKHLAVIFFVLKLVAGDKASYISRQEDIPTIVGKSSYQGADTISGIPIVEPFKVGYSHNYDTLSLRQGTAPAKKSASTSASKFYIRSPSFPSTIPADPTLEWTIQRNSSAVCRLRIEFNKLELPVSTACEDDSLTVFGNGEDISICGTKTGQIQYFNFPQPEATAVITYTDDGIGDPNPGIQLLVTQDVNGCSGSGVTNLRQFFIESLNFRTANNYAVNLNQRWIITRNDSSVCQLDLFFVKFEVDRGTGTDCTNDFFEYSDFNTKRKVCGKITALTKRMVTWPKAQTNYEFRFVSDASANAKGFSLFVSQKLGTCS